NVHEYRSRVEWFVRPVVRPAGLVWTRKPLGPVLMSAAKPLRSLHDLPERLRGAQTDGIPRSRSNKSHQPGRRHHEGLWDHSASIRRKVRDPIAADRRGLFQFDDDLGRAA